MANGHRRLILNNFLSPDVCKELEFIHKGCGTIGYRPNVFSTTLAHLASTNCAHLILPLVSIRESLLEKVEEFFECQYGLVIEFTGLIRISEEGVIVSSLALNRSAFLKDLLKHSENLLSWTKGASIGWHSDDNRPYLKQRHYAAVCYLNSYNKDFKGGLFHFQHGEPSTIIPMAGDVVMYTADDQNIHSVDEITEGERVTLTLWFSRDQAHSEDEKVLGFLSQGSWDSFGSHTPVPASNSMYWFPPDEAPKFLSGFDIRCARLSVVGLDLCSPNDRSFYPTTNSSSFSLDLSMNPVQIAKENELFQMQFANILHVLQVVQFYCWKDVEVKASDVKELVKPVSREQGEQIKSLREAVLKDADKFVWDLTCGRGIEGDKFVFEWNRFCGAVVEWERYSQKLCEELVRMLPYWTKHASIFFLSPSPSPSPSPAR